MDDWRVRRCGGDWRYCNGNCEPCLKKYKPATNKTDAPKDWPSYLDLPKRRDGGEGNGRLQVDAG